MTDIIRLHAHRAILGEGPTWRPRENAVYWIDLRAPAIFRYDAPPAATRRCRSSSAIASAPWSSPPTAA